MTCSFSLGRWGKTAAMAAVFIISAIVHEQIIACAMGFFYPVLMLMFGGPGVYFVNLTKKNTRFYNVFLWLMLSVGNALLMVLYSREWYARWGEHPVQYPVSDNAVLLSSWTLSLFVGVVVAAVESAAFRSFQLCCCLSAYRLSLRGAPTHVFCSQGMSEGWMMLVPRSFLAFYQNYAGPAIA